MFLKSISGKGASHVKRFFFFHKRVHTICLGVDLYVPCTRLFSSTVPFLLDFELSSRNRTRQQIHHLLNESFSRVLIMQVEWILGEDLCHLHPELSVFDALFR